MDASLQVPDPPSPKRGGGPATQEGISITKYNSTVHGFTDRRTVIARLGERKEEYLALVPSVVVLQPGLQAVVRAPQRSCP